jgi:hypothetical protein
MTGEMGAGMPQADGRVVSESTMDVDNVVKSIVMMANLPLDANVPFLTVMSNTMPFIGRG